MAPLELPAWAKHVVRTELQPIVIDYELAWWERREELIAQEQERLTAERARLEAVKRFVASHSPGEDAWIDDSVTPAVVRWTGCRVSEAGISEPCQCAASNFREARDELRYG